MKVFILTLVTMLMACAVQAQPRVIAHRGFWKAEGSAQNSITALKKAAEAGLYGSEFDVWMTADGKLVVYHDSQIDGKTIQDTDYKDLKKLRIANGEKLPTLKKYLKAGRKLPDLQLIFEIKPHRTKAREDLVIAKCVDMVMRYGLEDQVDYISFSINMCELLARLVPGAPVAFLGGRYTPQQLHVKGINGLDFIYGHFQKHPEWVKQAHDMGMKVNVWTVNRPDVMQQMIDLGVDYITTDQPLELKALLAE